MQKRQNKLKWNNYRIGLILTVAMTFVILLGIFWTPYDPEMMQGSLKLKGPSLAHWFGTDQFGRDVLSRVVRGAGSTFLIGVGTTLIGGIGRDDPRSCDRIFRRLAGRDPDACQ